MPSIRSEAWLELWAQKYNPTPFVASLALVLPALGESFRRKLADHARCFRDHANI